MKRIIALAATLAVVALMTLVVPALAQGPTGGGMMGGQGGMTPALACGASVGGWVPGQAITQTLSCGYGPAMMGGCVPGEAITPTVPFSYGYGMMGGRGMMGGYAPNGKPIVLDQAVTNAQQYLAAYNNADLKLAEVEEYTRNFYVVVKEKSTGVNAFQIVVDKYTGAVRPEMGPNMMWNTKYSPMTWMTGNTPGAAAGKLTVTLDQARSNAVQYLKANLQNTTVEDKGDTFYGYYNFDVLQNGKTYGMLSVNGYTGAVWFHTWHGYFISAKTLE